MSPADTLRYRRALSNYRRAALATALFTLPALGSHTSPRTPVLLGDREAARLERSDYLSRQRNHHFFDLCSAGRNR